MKLFITGAAGFIGRAVTERALSLGYDVKAVSLHGGEVAGLRVDAINVEDEEALKSYSSRLAVDAVLHLACRVPDSFADADARDVLIPNALSTLLALEAAVRMKAKKFMYAGSAVYGPGEGRYTESSVMRPFNFYSTSKQFGDLLCEQFTNSGRMSCTSLRISAPYGSFQRRPTVIQRFVKAALENQAITLWGQGSRKQDFVHVSDVAGAFFLALSRNATGPFNIASGESVSMADLARRAKGAVAGCTSEIVYSGRPDPQEGYRPSYDISRARNLLGYEPKVSLDEGLRRMVEAMSQKAVKR